MRIGNIMKDRKKVFVSSSYALNTDGRKLPQMSIALPEKNNLHILNPPLSAVGQSKYATKNLSGSI